MGKYRKKSIIIEAEQYKEFGKLVKGMCNSQICFAASNCNPHVHTIHKGQTVDLEIGDWIITEPDGKHFYPCKPDIFKETYELVGDDPDEFLDRFMDNPEGILRQTINEVIKENK